MNKKQYKKDGKVMANFFSFGASINNLPKFEETIRQTWIQYGDNNLFPDYLITLMNSSSKHNSLLKKKVNMAAGNGWEKNDELKSFIENENGKEDLNEIVFKNAYDLMVYGAYAIAITWSKDRKSIARISYVDTRKIRIAKQTEDDSEMTKLQEDGVDFYWISSDWSKFRKTKNKPTLIQGFSKEHTEEATQLIYTKEYRPGTDFYTLPDYISSIDWIELDKEIANFHLSSVHNGFTPGMIISFRGGIPTDEEMDVFYKDVQKKYAGSNNASRVFIMFSENSDTAPEFIPIQLNSSDERFLALEEQIMQNIIVGHGATPIIAGVATSGKLGSSGEIIEAEMIFQKNVIDAKQILIERTYNKLATINGLTAELQLDGIESFDDIVSTEQKEIPILGSINLINK